MKRVRQIEQEQALVNAESDLRQRLHQLLPKVVASGYPLFFNSQFSPHRLPILDEAEALFEFSLACIRDRERLDLPVAGSVGHLFVEACEEAASINEHRRGPRKLAAELLDALERDA
jgi:hypothetical protein